MLKLDVKDESIDAVVDKVNIARTFGKERCVVLSLCLSSGDKI